MRHCRTDYEAIQPFPTKRPHIVKVKGETVDASDNKWLGLHMDPVIPDDEPVFLLRAKDPAAALIVHAWANLVSAQGGEPELVTRVHAWADEMDLYRLTNHPDRVVADTPPQLLIPFDLSKDLHDHT